MTVFDGMIGPWFLPAFTEATEVDHLHYAVLLPSIERCLGRIRTRVRHGFEDEPATRQMHASFTAAGIDPRHVIANEDDDPRAAADEIVRRFHAGKLVPEVADRS
jgi:hypothetical protein